MAAVAQQPGLYGPAAVAVLEHGRRPCPSGQVPVTPSGESHHHRAQVKAGAGESVLVPRAPATIAVRNPLGQAAASKPRQPVGQHVPGDPEVVG